MTLPPPLSAPTRYCQKCGYILDGLEHGVCPECDRAFDPTNPATFDSHPHGRRVRLRKRALKILLIVLAVGAGLWFILNNLWWRHSTGVCPQCYATVADSEVQIFGFTIYHRQHGNLRGSPQLKAAQQACTHAHVHFHDRGHVVFPRRPALIEWNRYPGGNWPSELDAGTAWSWATVMDEFALYADEQQWGYPMDDKAWFVQQASGQDFGVTFDSQTGQPTAAANSVERILQWWVQNKSAPPPLAPRP